MSEKISDLDTFTKLLLHHARVRPERPAIREKDLGIWQSWTWDQFADQVPTGLLEPRRPDDMTLLDPFSVGGGSTKRPLARICSMACVGE